jgi:CelD/BcsL family acetyltransferase involved in cellulose biosynthesis
MAAFIIVVFMLGIPTLHSRPSNVNQALRWSMALAGILTSVPCKTIAAARCGSNLLKSAERGWVSVMSSTALFRNAADINRRRIERSRSAEVETLHGKITLRFTENIAELESAWVDLQLRAPCSPTQTFAWAKAWVRHMVWPEGREPAIITGHNADGKLLFLWPFEAERLFGLRMLKWLGQDHNNYNMGLFDQAAPNLEAVDLRRLFAAVGILANADLAYLRFQPFAWGGTPNPFVKLSLQPSPSHGYAASLGDFATIYSERVSKRGRRLLDRKERKLAELGALEYGVAEERDERLQMLESLFAQRSRQYAEMGVQDILDAHARAFYRDVALLEGDNASRLRLAYLKVGGTVAAMCAGSTCHRRHVVAFASMAEGEMQKQSPGALLLRQQIKEACDGGLAYFDFGAGQGRHKDQWCDIELPLFDTSIALRPHAHILTVSLSLAAKAKRAIKGNTRLWALAKRVRQGLFGRKTASAEEPSDGGGAAE